MPSKWTPSTSDAAGTHLQPRRDEHPRACELILEALAAPPVVEVLERLMTRATEDRRCRVIAAKADLSKCDLTGADLTGARLSYADLSDANLTNAQVDETIFCRTTMRDGSVYNSGC